MRQAQGLFRSSRLEQHDNSTRSRPRGRLESLAPPVPNTENIPPSFALKSRLRIVQVEIQAPDPTLALVKGTITLFEPLQVAAETDVSPLYYIRGSAQATLLFSLSPYARFLLVKIKTTELAIILSLAVGNLKQVARSLFLQQNTSLPSSNLHSACVTTRKRQWLLLCDRQRALMHSTSILTWTRHTTKWTWLLL